MPLANILLNTHTSIFCNFLQTPYYYTNIDGDCQIVMCIFCAQTHKKGFSLLNNAEFCGKMFSKTSFVATNTFCIPKNTNRFVGCLVVPSAMGVPSATVDVFGWWLECSVCYKWLV